MSTQAAKPNQSPSKSDAKEELRDQAHTVADDLRELGSIGKRAAEETAEAARDRAREVKDDTVAKVGDFEDQLVQYVREQPLKSVLIAAGAGAIASMWLRR